VTTAPEQSIDLIAVYRLLDDTGPRPELALHEKHYAAHVLSEEDRSLTQIADLLGVTQRTVCRWRTLPVATPDTTLAPAAWQAYARCSEVDAAMFFPSEDDYTIRSYSQARRVCISCTVRTECLDDALDREGDTHHDARAGMWGGLSPDQRHALAMARKGAAT
jgi:WhiB family redox-sensing transcriptional regulator